MIMNKTTRTFSAAVLLLILVQHSHQRSSPESDSYVAAVVEFSPTDPKTPDEPPTNANAASYVSFVESAAKQNADIIVFPEVGLTSINLPERDKWDSWTTIIPAPSRNYNPCIDSNVSVSEALRTISCSARQQRLYVVINIAEKVICNNEHTCPTDRRLYYNTNVVFDREGKIIARYRKSNLFREPQVNLTAVPEVVTFDTDFGVTFGTFICADILYKRPALYLTRMLNITDFVYPVAWFTSLPFATPLQIQAGWSFAEDVNLLAAGYNRPNFGNAGTGIYLGRQGIGKALMPQTTTRQLVMMQVPKKQKTNGTSLENLRRPAYSYSEEEARVPGDDAIQESKKKHVVHDELRRRRSVEESQSKFTIWQDDLSKYKSLRLDNSSMTQTAVCDGDFCCDFDVELTNVDPSSKYRLVVYDGTAVYQEPHVVGLRVCAVVICANDTVTSCVNLQQSETTFGSITINATYPNYEDILAFPSSVGANLYPLENWTYEERYDDKIVHVTTSLVGPTKNVLTFGLYTRDFSRDGPAPVGKNTSTNGMQWATLTALAIVSLFLLFLYRKGWRKPWQTDNQQLPSDAAAAASYGPYQTLSS